MSEDQRAYRIINPVTLSTIVSVTPSSKNTHLKQLGRCAKQQTIPHTLTVLLRWEMSV